MSETKQYICECECPQCGKPLYYAPKRHEHGCTDPACAWTDAPPAPPEDRSAGTPRCQFKMGPSGRCVNCDLYWSDRIHDSPAPIPRERKEPCEHCGCKPGETCHECYQVIPSPLPLTETPDTPSKELREYYAKVDPAFTVKVLKAWLSKLDDPHDDDSATAEVCCVSLRAIAQVSALEARLQEAKRLLDLSAAYCGRACVRDLKDVQCRCEANRAFLAAQETPDTPWRISDRWESYGCARAQVDNTAGVTLFAADYEVCERIVAAVNGEAAHDRLLDEHLRVFGEEADKYGNYPHAIVCSGSRKQPAGHIGGSCACLPSTRKLRAENERLKARLSDMEQRLKRTDVGLHLPDEGDNMPCRCSQCQRIRSDRAFLAQETT